MIIILIAISFSNLQQTARHYEPHTKPPFLFKRGGVLWLRGKNWWDYSDTYSNGKGVRVMPLKLLRLFLAFVLLGSLCISCGNSEKKARTKLNEALSLKSQQDFVGSLSLLKEVVSEYPETKAAAEAAGELEKLRDVMMIHFRMLTDQGKSSEAMELWEIIKLEYPDSAEVIAARRVTTRSKNAAAKSNLMNAYVAARAYFTERPDGSLNLDVLRAYGFRQGEGTKLRILINTSDGFTMTSEHSDGDKIYTIYPDGHIEDLEIKSQYRDSREVITRSMNAAAESNIKNAYTAAQAYFHDNPTGSVDSVGILHSYGFRQTNGMRVSPSGNQRTLKIVGYHSSGDRTYTVDSRGVVTNN